METNLASRSFQFNQLVRQVIKILFSIRRFKTNLAILSSKSYAALAGGQAGQRVGANQADSWINREATSTGAVGRFNRQSTLVRLGGINRERSVMQTKRMDFPLKSQPQ
ncbi:hypothetical protein BOX15_Mlig024794g1 [Macrostomum lignano]|uniref:Uncharacterized protein n=1 Tax=Macrostomum lignano TaxID=282301 RepID=A0A267FW92_9PLAT|nr:hypothetical protein BOX15_Mlig024794g1 [Macrostomum lignano]